MKTVYLGRQSRRVTPAPDMEGDVLELLADNWDDYGNKTTFATTCRIAGKRVELGYLKLMLEDADSSERKLDKLREEGWNGIFPIPGTRYLSLPGEISFYEQLRDRLGEAAAKQAAQQLRDASYLVPDYAPGSANLRRR